MPNYIYKARDKHGELITATVEATTELQVAQMVRSMGHSVVSVEPEGGLRFDISDVLQRIKKINRHEFVFFSRQLAALLKSGISLTDALSSIAEQTRSKMLRERLTAVVGDIQGGASFSMALSKHPDLFSELFVSMVKVGETGGILDEVLERLAALNVQELEIRTRIRSAMMYPLILVSVAVVIVSFLLINIIPKFVVVFETFDAQLPVPTRILLGISFIMQKFWMIVLAAAACAGLWFRHLIKSGKRRYKFDHFLLRLPLWGTLYLKIVVSRFTRTLGVLLKSGVPILEALLVTEKVVGNAAMGKVIEDIRYAIVEGESLANPFKACGIFPPTVVQMVALGEKSGKLDDMLIDVASFYDQEVDYALKNITTALEPVLLLLMGGMVAFIALSVLLPIFNLIKVFKR